MFTQTAKHPSEVKSNGGRVYPPNLPVHTQNEPAAPSARWSLLSKDGKESSDEEVVQPAPSSDSATRCLAFAADPATNPMHMQKRMLPRYRKEKEFTSLRTWTCARYTIAGSTSAALASVTSLAPYNLSIVTEASALATLFDEAKCVGMKIFTRVTGSTGVVVNPTAAYCASFDPANNGAPLSVVGLGLLQQTTGPVALNTSLTASSGTTVSPLVENNRGYIETRIKVPGAVESTASSSNPVVGSNWVATSDQTGIAGYWKVYVDANTGTAFGVDIMVYYDMIYRSRT